MRMNRRQVVHGAVSVGTTAIVGRWGGQAAAAPELVCGVTIPTAATVPNPYLANPGLLALRADTLLRQLKLGYNYYGLPRNWVPPVSLTEFARRLDPILTNLGTVDQYLNAASCNVASQQEISNQYSQTQANLSAVAGEAGADLKATNDYIVQILSLISQLSLDIQTQYTVVLTLQKQFNEEEEHAATGGCSWQETFEIVVAIVAVVAAVYTAGTSLVALASSTALAATAGATAVGAAVTAANSLKEAADDLKAAYAAYQTIEKNIETAKAEINDIISKYNKLKQEFQMSVSQDAGRIALSEDDYDSMTKQKLDQFDKAVDSSQVPQQTKDEFKAAVHKYVDLVQLRNKKIFDHDAMVLTVQALSRSIVELQAQIDQAAGAQAELLAGQHIPDEVRYLSLLKQAHNAQIMLVRDLVWSECGALSLATMDAHLSSVGRSAALFSYLPSVANLVGIHNQTQANILNWQVARGPGTTTDTHTVRRSLGSADVRQLRDKRRVTVKLTQADFLPSMRQIYATAFKVDFDPHIPSLSGVLSHMGEHLFVTQQGSTVEFAAKVFPFAFNNADTPAGGSGLIDITEVGVFAGFSALGNWLLELDRAVSTQALHSVRAVVFTFEIAYRAPTA